MERKTLSIAGEQGKQERERCILCGRLTDVRKKTDIACRASYIPGVGQLCENCCMETYGTTDWRSKFD